MSNENVWPQKNFFQFHKSINNNFSFLCAMNTTTTTKKNWPNVCLFILEHGKKTTFTGRLVMLKIVINQNQKRMNELRQS